MRSFLTECELCAELLAECDVDELPGILSPFELEPVDSSEADTVTGLMIVYVERNAA